MLQADDDGDGDDNEDDWEDEAAEDDDMNGTDSLPALLSRMAGDPDFGGCLHFVLGTSCSIFAEFLSETRMRFCLMLSSMFAASAAVTKLFF